MPTIAIIDGVKVIIWHKDHLPPHLHARYGEHEAQISIRTSEVLNGKLPPAKLRAVLRWLDANRLEVAYLWREIVERGRDTGRID
jgi:hypothetical protein